MPWNELEAELMGLWERVQASNVSGDRWIMGLGHGVLRKLPSPMLKMPCNSCTISSGTRVQ